MLLAELDAALPPLIEKKTRKVAPKSDRTGSTIVRTPNSAAGDRPGDYLAAELPVSQMLIELYGAEEEGSDGLVIPDESGTLGEGANARIYAHDEDRIERVTVFGANRLSDFALDAENSLSSWDWLGLVLLRGDWSRAALLARHYAPAFDGAGWDEMISDIASFDRDVIALMEDAQVRLKEDDDGGLNALLEPIAREDGTEIDPQTATWSEAIEHRFEREFWIKSNSYAVTAGSRIGFWQKGKMTKEGREPDQRVTDWVVWRKEAHEYLTVDENGESGIIPKDGRFYRLELIDRFGRRYLSRRLFSATDSLTVAAIDEFDAGVTMPDRRDQERVLWDAMRHLGRHDGSQKRHAVYTTTGWLHEEDKEPVFLLPSGSYDHNVRAVSESYQVDSSPGSEGAGLSRLDRKMGLESLSQNTAERREALDALFSLIDIAGERAGVALIGTLLSPMTGQQMNASLDLFGVAGSGKSWIAAAAQSFLTSYPLTGKAFMIDIPRSTKNGATLKSALYRHLPVFADDLRVNGSMRETEAMRSLVTTLVQTAYGAEGTVKGASASTLADVPPVTAGAVITSEFLIQESAIMRRLIGIEATEYSADALRKFKRGHVRDGVTLRFTGDYVAWLAERISTLGGVAELAEEATERSEDWATENGGDRSGVDVVGVIAAAWSYLLEYMEEHDLTHPKVTARRVQRVLVELADQNAENVASTDVGKAILDAARGLLEGAGGYVTPWHGQPPVSKDAAVFGYQQAQTDSGAGGFFAPAGATMLGYVSKDGESVVLSAHAMLKLRGLAGYAGMSADQIYRLLRKHADPDAPTPGKQQSVRLGLIAPGTGDPLRPKGITIPAAALGRRFPTTPKPKRETGAAF